MGGSSGGGENTTVQKSDPWSAQQPYLEQGMAQAQTNLATGGPQYYPGSTVAPQSANTQQAYGMVQNDVTNNPLATGSAGQVQNTLAGNYLNPATNPWLAGTFAAGTQAIDQNYYNTVGQVASGAEANGRYGSGMQTQQNGVADKQLADSLGALEANTYGQNYTTERQNQVNAVGQANDVQNQQLTGANALGSVGTAQDTYAQNQTNADVNKWNYNQNLPNNTLSQFMGLIQGNYGGSSSTQTPLIGQSLLGNLLAGTSLAAGASSAFG